MSSNEPRDNQNRSPQGKTGAQVASDVDVAQVTTLRDHYDVGTPPMTPRPEMSGGADGTTPRVAHDLSLTIAAAAVDAHTAETGIIADRYFIEERLGAGTFGAVYRCRDTRLNVEVALKLAHRTAAPTEDAAFLHEARAAAAATEARHASIVRVREIDKLADGRPYVVYDLVIGDSIKQIQAKRAIDWREATAWVAELADALYSVHTRDVVHRDIKPENILIDQTGRPQLTDFGLARVENRFFVDEPGRLVGTAYYMSPEQADRCAQHATSRSDLYALGVVLYELLAGRRPFTEQKLDALIEQIQKRVPDAPSTYNREIDPRLDEICRKLLAKNPEDRYATGRELANDLRAVLAPAPIPRGKGWVGLAIIWIAAAALAVGGYFGRDLLRSTPPAASIPVAPPAVPVMAVKYAPAGGDPVAAGSPIVAGSRAWEGRSAVDIDVKVDPPAYVYVFWFDSSDSREPLALLWPASLERASTERAARPPICDAPAEAGQDVLLAITLNTPLSTEDYDSLRGEIVSQLSAIPEQSVALELLPGAQPIEVTAVRAVRVRENSRKNAAVPAILGNALRARQASYHGWIVPRLAAPVNDVR